MSVTAETIVGGHRVLHPLGRGSAGAVFAAVAPDGELVALKLGTDPERFLRGARAQAGLAHPAIVGVRAFGTDPEHGPWLAMDLVDGPTLAALELTPARAVALLRDVAAALDHAHAAGVVHRDVKPSNVLVAGDRALLADFGLARDGGATDGTRTGAVLGSLPYLAPELVRGARATPASDRYALAAVAFELLTGAVPFPRRTDAAILFAHVDAPVPAATAHRPGLPHAVDAVLARGLAKRPEDRLPDATTFVAALDAALAGTTVGPPPRGARTLAPTVDPGKWSVLRPLPGKATTGLVLAAVAITAALIARGGDEPVAPAPGHVFLGSALDAPAVEARDCRDAAPTGASPACTVLQTELPGRMLVVPRDGAIRAWTVRGAHGELVLQVLRRRDAQIFQVVRSQPQLADGGKQRFAAALPARAGDVVALALVPGATVGVAPDVAGARTERWTDPVSADRPPGTRTGFAHDVQLQVELEPGARIPAPEQVTGAAAAALPAGREVAAGDVALPDRRRVRVALVEHDGRVYVDLFREDRRRARIVVPDLETGGEVVEFKPFESAGDPSQLNVAWRNPGTRGDIFHYFGLDAEALEFYS